MSKLEMFGVQRKKKDKEEFHLATKGEYYAQKTKDEELASNWRLSDVTLPQISPVNQV